MGSGAAAAAEREALAGLVERVTYHNAETGFCVLRVKARGQRELVTVVGAAASITAGEFVQASGSWVNDRAHGLQFKAAFLRSTPPPTLDGIERYLGSGMVKGIGLVYAKRLVAAFTEAVFDVVEQSPGRLCEVAGIGPKRAERIAKGWAEQKVVREIMLFLHGHGVGTNGTSNGQTAGSGPAPAPGSGRWRSGRVWTNARSASRSRASSWPGAAILACPPRPPPCSSSVEPSGNPRSRLTVGERVFGQLGR